MKTTSVDPGTVPQRKLRSGALMPAIGLGTFGSDHVSPDEVADAVSGAFEVGYRHFDCAAVYGNEDRIGRVLQALPREDIRVTSKLWNDKHAPGEVVLACQASLADLRLGYLDTYLVHWPFPNYHPPRADVTSRSRRPALCPPRVDGDLGRDGAVGRYGTGAPYRNVQYDRPKLELVLGTPASPRRSTRWSYTALPTTAVSLCAQPGYRADRVLPHRSPARPVRDRSPDDSVDIEDPVLIDIARDHGVHPAVICVKWAVQRGQARSRFRRRPATTPPTCGPW